MFTTSLSVRVLLSVYFLATICVFFSNPTTAFHVGEPEEEGGDVPVPVPVPARHGAMVKKDQRWSVVTTEFGEISAVKVRDNRDGFYHLQFITMEPNSLFLPVHLHSDMVFYVESGSGTLNWVDLENDDDKLRQVELQTGDVYRLRTGSFFYLQSKLDSDRRKLRINAIFSDSREEIREGSSFGAYSSVRDLILGFDNRVLQAALSVDERVIEELRSGGKQAMIVHGVAKGKAKELWDVHYRIMRAFLGRMKNEMIDINKKDDKYKAYNMLTADHDVENCNGWSLVVTSKQLDALKDSDFGVFMVNLTKGAMMGPHWNPTTAEIGVVLSGRGMVHVVCPGSLNETECRNSRFRVEKGDLFVIPRYHPMAQMSFNNGSFVFMGFTTTTKKNHPQYLVGKASVLQVLDKGVLAASFGVSNVTMDEVLEAQREAIIVECTSCAEEEERLMEEEMERAKEEEKAREEEEKAKEEEEEAKRREEEKAREKEEEEAKRREEEKRRQEEEEEEARRQEEEERREQEEARKREEEEARRQEEEAAKRREEQEEEEARKQKEEEEAAKRREEQEEEEAKKQKEEEARRQEEEAARRREEQEEEARKQQEEEEAARRRQQEEEEARKQQEEEAARRQEEEAARRQEEQEEEARRRQQEEEARRRQEEEGRRRHEEEGAGRGGGGRGQGEGEAASREEEEMARREREAEAAARGRGGQGNESYEEW